MSGPRNNNGHVDPYPDYDYRDEGSDSKVESQDVANYPFTGPASGFMDWFTGKMSRNSANAFNAYAQEDSQAHDFEFAEFSAGLQQKYHEMNMVNDPILMAEGLKGAGLSSAAVAQALSGNTPNGYSPTVNPGTGGQASGHGLEQPLAAQAMMQLPLQLAQARLANSQATFTETQNDWFPKLTQQQIDESAARIRQEDEKIGLSADETASRVALNNALVNKTFEEIKAIGEDIKVKGAQINRWAHQNNLDDKESWLAFQNAILAQKQGKVADANVGLINAEASKTWNESDLQAMQNEMYEMKLGIATLLGMPMDSDEVSVAMMSMATGNFGMYNDVITTNLTSAEGTAKRLVNSMHDPVDSDTRTKTYYKKRHITSRRHKPRRSPYVNVTN